MRSYICTILMVCAFSVGYSQDKAGQVVDKVLAKLDECQPYKVEIDVVCGIDSISGFYEVDDDAYYISIDQQELYGDSEVKYEVFNSRKEILIDNVSPEYNGNLLSNPAVAFNVIKDHYSTRIISDNKDITLVELKPNVDGDNSIESIELTVSNISHLPIKINYKFGDDNVTINIVKLEKNISSITRYNSSNYADYEVIDFR